MTQKLLVVSDNHGNFSNLEYVLDYFKKKYKAVVHCGDSEIAPDELEKMFSVPVYMAKGNCDYLFDREPYQVFEFAGHTCYVTHGHLEGINWDDEAVIERAKEAGADIIFFGHTHVPAFRQYEEDGIIMLNPGSIQLPRQYPPQPTFLIVDFKDDGSVVPHFYTL